MARWIRRYGTEQSKSSVWGSRRRVNTRDNTDVRTSPPLLHECKNHTYLPGQYLWHINPHSLMLNLSHSHTPFLDTSCLDTPSFYISSFGTTTIGSTAIGTTAIGTTIYRDHLSLLLSIPHLSTLLFHYLACEALVRSFVACVCFST